MLYNRKKRGQISLFIIMGIIILVGTFVVLYIKGIQEEKIEVSTEKLVSAEIPSWAEPVNQYVEQCIQTIAIKGFKAIGEHGGYIDPNDKWLSGRSFSITNNPTESDAVLLSQQGFSPTAYWWYLKSPNNCIDCYISSLTPLLPEIEEQMNRYIDRELEKCLNNFSAFKEEGFQFKTGTIKTNTLIQQDDVDILVDYPIDITKVDSRTLIPRFHLEFDLRFREIFELAFLTTLNQIENQTQEDILMHLIGIYSGVSNPNKMAPIGWLDHRKGTVTWNIDTIKDNLKQYVLGSHIPLIQIDKTRDAKHITVSNPLMQGLYDVMYLKFLENPYPNLAVNLLYDPSWEIYLDVTPKSGKLLAPTTTSQDFLLNILPSKNTNFYQFFYDVSYPVIVTIRDDQSLTKYGEKGYTFMFALEVNVRDNKDLLLWKTGQGTIGEVNYDNIKVSFKLANASGGNCTQINSKWICSLDGQQYTTQMLCIQNCIKETTQIIRDVQTQAAESLFCNYNQRISKDITINVFDKQNNPLDDVSISYKCGNHRTCSIGSTDNNGKYIGKFPICFGDGFLKLEKEGYLTKLEPHISIDLDNSKKFNIYLEKLEEREVEIVYINVTNLFRIKRNLYAKNKENILDDLYYKTVHMSGYHRITTYHGILGEIYYKANPSIQRNLLEHGSAIDNARNSIKGIEHYYQLDANNIVKATKSAKDAAECAWTLVNNPVSKISISESNKNKLEQYVKWLNKEWDNIQFLQDYELVNNLNIQKFRNKATSLQPNEQAIITVEKIKENQYEQNMPIPSIMVEYNQPQKISLAPGRYGVVIASQDKVGYIIPGASLLSTFTTSIPGYGSIGSSSQPDIEYTYLGGININENSGYWVITENDLKNSKKVRLYIFRLDKAENIEDIGEVEKIEYYSKHYRAYIEPEFLP